MTSSPSQARPGHHIERTHRIRQRDGHALLRVTHLGTAAPPVHHVLAWAGQHDRPFALQSGRGDPRLSEWSYAGLEPVRQLPCFSDAYLAVGGEHVAPSAPRPSRGDVLPPFTGGAVGFIGYDQGWAYAAKPRAIRPDPLDFPPTRFFLYDAIYARCERTGAGFVISEDHPDAMARARRLLQALSRRPRALPSGHLLGALKTQVTQREHEARIREALARIRDGDVYQLNLSHPLRGRFSGDPRSVLPRLRAPFSAYLRVDDDGHLISASPECFVDLDPKGKLHTFPIKGTRARGRGVEDDRASALALTRDPKERAEHLMVVDLLRNDLGRVATMGSVEVDGLAYVESFPTVHHLTSSVRAQVRPGVSPEALLQAVFPGGSITGTPKLRAMELIDALEGEARGAYTGSIVWIDRRGSLRGSIAIRTAQLRGDELRFGVGGGIVYDSDPGREWEETLLKSRALGRALSDAGEAVARSSR